MVDTLPPHSQRPSKFLDRQSVDGTQYKSKGGYICDVCSCNDKQAANCIFARWNREGIMAAYSPNPRYRKKHKRDIVDSPLVQAVAEDPRMNLLASYKLNPSIVSRLPHVVVPTYNEISRLAREVRQIRKMS
jgi:hypothetical protein